MSVAFEDTGRRADNEARRFFSPEVSLPRTLQ
jgi:hypothetical protein